MKKEMQSYSKNLESGELDKYCKEKAIVLHPEQKELILHILEFEGLDRFKGMATGLSFAFEMVESYVKGD